MKVRSLRFEKNYDLQLYAVEENALVIRHRSLEKIYWELPDKERPKAEYEVLDLAKLPGIPALFAIKCHLSAPPTSCNTPRKSGSFSHYDVQIRASAR